MPVHFLPKILKKHIFSHLVVLCALAILWSLGTWQYQRWQFKNNLLQQEASMGKQIAVTPSELIQTKGYSSFDFRAATLQGSTVPEKIFLLDNQTHQGQVGYDVLSVLYLNDNQAILLNRGWIVAKQDRQKLPLIKPLSAQYSGSGTLRIPSKPAFLKNALESTSIQWPLRIQYIDFNTLEEILGVKLIPLVLNLNEGEAGTYLAKANLQSWLTPERHLGYSMQWFGLSLCLIIIYLLMLRKKG